MKTHNLGNESESAFCVDDSLKHRRGKKVEEIKQNMGFLKEQTGNYTVHYASIHLAAIRYLLFYGLFLAQDSLSFGEVRNRITGKLERLSFATVLWELFKSIIHGTLDKFVNEIGSQLVLKIKNAIDTTVEHFLLKALQIDEASIQNQLKAEAIGAM